MYGFVDLRLNKDAGTGGDSFWPSFTDIMAVIVMIFLIATSLLILKNWDLLKEITATAEAEKAAAELAKTTSEEKATVEEQLAQAQHQLSMARLEILRAEAEQRRDKKQILGLENTITDLENRNNTLSLRLEKTEAAKQKVSDLFDNLMQEFSALQLAQETTRTELQSSRQALAEQLTQYERLSETSAQTTTELGELQLALQQKEDALLDLQKTSRNTESQYASLQGELDELRVKYDRLVRPARTAVGKYVVEVRYQKTASDFLIQYRGPNETTYQTLNEQDLHKILSGLRDQHPDTLYIKIIFPETSGLSYREAWDFTQQLLSQYDYYHRLR